MKFLAKQRQTEYAWSESDQTTKPDDERRKKRGLIVVSILLLTVISFCCYWIYEAQQLSAMERKLVGVWKFPSPGNQTLWEFGQDRRLLVKQFQNGKLTVIQTNHWSVKKQKNTKNLILTDPGIHGAMNRILDTSPITFEVSGSTILINSGRNQFELELVSDEELRVAEQ